jgi:hypothetical protein
MSGPSPRAPLAHPTLKLADLHPDRSAAFSPNLYKYLKRHGQFYADGGTPVGVHRIKPDTKMAEAYGAGSLMIGTMDGVYLSGSLLMAVLCNGTTAPRFAYPVGSALVPVDGFWEAYLDKGRCSIDAAHDVPLLGDRFSLAGDVRTCLWCRHQQRRILTPRTVIDETWESA